MKPARLESLLILEVSGVDEGANQSDGWLLMKQRSEGRFVKTLLAQPPEVQEQILDALDSVHPVEDALARSMFRPGRTLHTRTLYL